MKRLDTLPSPLWASASRLRPAGPPQYLESINTLRSINRSRVELFNKFRSAGPPKYLLLMDGVDQQISHEVNG